MWGTWITAAVVATGTGVIRPLVRRLTWNDLAALAERGAPSLGERLTSAVGLLRQRSHGSPELIAAVVDDATERAGQVDLTRAVSIRGSIAWLIAGGIGAALIVLPAIVQPDPFAHMGKRFLFPWADIDRVGRFAVEVAPGDKVVALGSDVSFRATVQSRFGEAVPRDQAWLEWTGTVGTPNRVKMVAAIETKQSTQAFTVTLPRLTGSLRYRALIGEDSSRRHQIKAVEPPAVDSLKAHVEPPPYTKRSGATARDPARIEAWEDSLVTLEIEATRPLKQAEVTWPVMRPDGESTSGSASSRVASLKLGDDGKRWSATVMAELSGTYALMLRDEYDLVNPPEAMRRVVVRPDAPPIVAVAAPDEFKETSPDDFLTLAIAARDDVAVASAELHYTIERSQGSTGPISGNVAAPLDGLGTPTARGEAALSLATLALKPGDTISYRVRVTDNRPAPRGPNITWSTSHLLRIIEHSESLRGRQETADREALRARLEGIQKAAAVNRQKADQLRNDADLIRRGHGIWDETKSKELAARETSAREVSDQLQLLSRDLEEHPTFNPLARPARQVAEVESQAARAALETARRAGDPARRQAELEQAGARLAAVTSKVDELKRKFDELARLDDDRRRLSLLAQREDELAARADQLAQAGDRANLEALADEQDRVRRELDELLKNSPSLRSEALAAQSQEADALAARARALAEQQREEARRTAADGARTAAIKALAARQRALEDDARRFALRVDEPLAQNSRGRVDVDALARAGDAMERGDFDQARDRANEAENALNRLTRDVEDVRNDPKALARRLAQRQEGLKNETAEAVREAREHPPQTPEGKAALTDRLKPLIDRQEAIARLAAAIPAPPEQKDAARDATQKTAKARDDLHNARPRDVEGHQNEARDALNRLADALPDPNQRRDRARQKLGEARSRYEEIARDLERHLRETAAKPGQPHDPVRDAADLAQRIAPLAQREREVALALSAIDPEARAFPQRDRAARRALELADALAVTPPPEVYRPITNWHVVGPLPGGDKPPFATDAKVDLSKKHNNRKGQPASWQAVKPVNDRGAIDLANHYSNRDNGSAAFGYAELKSVTTRHARMLIGSNDTFTVWLNGKQVYDSQISRSWAPDQARIDVSLDGGTNCILVKCGNTGGNWMYSVALSEDAARPLDDQGAELAHAGPSFERLREALPAVQVGARSALDRLQQKLDGQMPADDLAAALAADQRDLKSTESKTPAGDAAARAELAANQRRIANALSNLEAPDAALAKTEAVRRADLAARALEPPATAEPRAAIAHSTDAAQALARRLGDEQSLRELDKLAAATDRVPVAAGREGTAQNEALPAADDPALGVTPADQTDATALAQRQRHIREGLQAILGEAAGSQQVLRERSTALGHDVADLRDRAKEISPRAQWPAQAAADLFGRSVPETMDRAAAVLHQGRPADALQTQRQAADQAEQGARHTEDLAAALRADRPSGAVDPATDGLAKAQSDVRGASQHLSQARAGALSPAEASQSTRAAAVAMHKAAQGLRATDRSTRGSPSARESATTANDPRGTLAGKGDPDVAGLKAAVRAKTGRTWGELPGHLRTEILQVSQGRYRDDYARLIELYFREIAADAADRGARP